MALANPDTLNFTAKQKIAVILGLTGLFILTLGAFDLLDIELGLAVSLALGLIFMGVILFSKALYDKTLPGIKNDGVCFKSMS